MTAVAASSVPTLADARAAAEVLVAEGAVEVLLYGSVARGEASEGSDIDLVAVFADVDYAERRDIKARLEAAAGATVAWPVQVHVTDLPEWRARIANVSASFEHSISRYAVAVAADGVGSQPNWAKIRRYALGCSPPGASSESAGVNPDSGGPHPRPSRPTHCPLKTEEPLC